MTETASCPITATLSNWVPHMNGLTSVEAAARLAAEGTNELAQDGRRRIWQIAFEVLREPMLVMLLAAGAIYISLGDLE